MSRKDRIEFFNPPKDVDWEDGQRSAPTDHLIPKDPRRPQTEQPDRGDCAEESPSSGHYFPDDEDGGGGGDDSGGESQSQGE
jgi:hypothetical protein